MRAKNKGRYHPLDGLHHLRRHYCLLDRGWLKQMKSQELSLRYVDARGVDSEADNFSTTESFSFDVGIYLPLMLEVMKYILGGEY